MSRRYTLVPTPLPPRTCQVPWVTSFVGGRPKIPPSLELPTCGLCGAVQTFFLQVAFPDRHEWAGLTLAIFRCTSCFDWERLAPRMGRKPLGPGEDIPDGELDEDQINYRFLVFPTAQGVVRAEYEERIRYMPIDLITSSPAVKTRSHIGGKPRWIQGGETPGCYGGEPLDFLMQWEEWFRFRAVEGAPYQRGPHDEQLRGFSLPNVYSLFVSLELYFFGNHSGGKPNVYPICQRT